MGIDDRYPVLSREPELSIAGPGALRPDAAIALDGQHAVDLSVGYGSNGPQLARSKRIQVMFADPVNAVIAADP